MIKSGRYGGNRTKGGRDGGMRTKVDRIGEQDRRGQGWGGNRIKVGRYVG